MKKLLNLLTVAMLVVGFVFCFGSYVTATTFSINTVDGDWVNAVPAAVTINNSGTGGGLSTARWGTPASGTSQSGYDFLSVLTPFDAFSDGTAFALGDFTHQNYPILSSGISLDTIDLQLAVEDLGIFDLTATFNLDHNETPNSGPNPNDIVTIANPIINQLFSYSGQNYYFNLFGFSQDGGATLTTEFSTIENQRNTATLYARITEAPVNPVPEPSTSLLMGIGLLGIAGYSRKRLSKKS